MQTAPTPDPLPFPSSRPRAVPLAVGGLLALASALGIGRFVFTPILPPMAAALGLSKSAAGLIASANFLGYLVGALLAAAPRLPGTRRGWFLASLALGAATTAAMAAASGMVAFLVLRFVGGVASAVVLVFGSALVLDRLAALGRGRLSAVHFTGIGAGIAGSALLVDALTAHGVGWRGLWLAAGLAAGVVVPAVAWLVPGERGGARSAPLTDAPLPRGFMVLVLSYGLFGLGYVVTATFLVAAVRGAPNGAALEAAVWVVVGLAAIPSTAIWNRVAARWGVMRAYIAACLVQAAGVAAGGWGTTTVFALIAAALLGSTIVGLTALGFAAARAWVPPAAHRRAFAILTAGFGLGQIVGPLVAGVLLDRTGSFEVPSLLAAAALVTAAAVALRVRL